MPYFKVFGGDVRVGGGVNTTTPDVCTPNNTATIKGQNRGSGDNYAGSGVQHAAFSNGFISQFVSGQYNRNFTTTRPPVGLTFANNAGGSGYGGGFGTGGGCIDPLQQLPSDAEESTGDTILNGKGLLPNDKVVQHVKGDVLITNNITYGTTWTDVRQIPLYELVVEGNIFIAGNVTQLDGLYVALSNAAGTSGGHIYTCATGMRSLPTNTFTGCKRQLVVNGSFVAKQVHLLRDCGSLKYSPSDVGTTYSGGVDDQTCNVTNHAAEVFNYGPEQWIRAAAGFPSDAYDSISSMPPVL